MAPVTTIPEHRRWAARLALLLGGCAFGALFLELGLRGLRIQPSRGPYDPNIGDAVVGMKPVPSQTQKADFPEYQGTLILRTNNLGFYQEKNTAVEPTPGVLRMAVLGDSFTAGVSNANENFPSVLEQLLNEAHPLEPVEVLNAGVGRYAPYQSYVRLQHEILRLKPRHVIVAEYVGNDFLDMIRQDDRPYLTERADGTWEPHPPRFVYYEDPSIRPGILDHSRLFAILKGLAGPTVRYQYSRVRIMRENLSNFGYGNGAIASYIFEVAKLDRIAHGMMLEILHQQVWFDRFPATLDPALRVNREVIAMYRELCQRQGIRLTYTAIPSADMIEPELMRDTFARLQQHDSKWTPQRVAAFDERLTNETMRACQELGVEYIDLREGLRKRKTSSPMYYPRDMHMNPTAYRAVAETLASSLLAKK